MALDMTPEQKAIGKANFQRAVGKLSERGPSVMGVTRRQFMKGLAAAGATLPIAAAAYFGYTNSPFANRPVKAGIIGTGDEGGVLVGEHNPAYLQFIAYSDIRPSNKKRIFEDERTRNAASPRKGFRTHYGAHCDKEGSTHYIQAHDNYEDLLRRSDIEAVVIALPLNMHYKAVMDALDAGQHVLCEKLMAWNIRQCKEMIKKAREKDLLLAVGHQRHYSMMYAHAVEAMETGILGDIHHIRALWHRNNARPLSPRDADDPTRIYTDSWRPRIPPEDVAHLRNTDLSRYGFDNLNQLIRWRLYRKTGGGLMAELGSHQLDACSIFLGKRRNHEVYPIAVTGNGGKHFYQDDREIEDHVYCMFEFPGKNYRAGQPTHDAQGNMVYNDVVMVNYSSINTAPFQTYGECVMGSKGMLIAEAEQSIMLYGISGVNTNVTVNTTGGRPALDASASVDPAPAAERRAQETGQASLADKPSKGYREEMEHFAYCIRMRNEGMERDRENLKPRCDGPAAMADAIMAFAANQAIKTQSRIEFRREWFNADLDPSAANSLPPWDPR
jgi:predicted dehydrogenase